eukprot:scaffold15778_cov208-Isochrysis_galbana.AAC.2
MGGWMEAVLVAVSSPGTPPLSSSVAETHPKVSSHGLSNAQRFERPEDTGSVLSLMSLSGAVPGKRVSAIDRRADPGLSARLVLCPSSDALGSPTHATSFRNRLHTEWLPAKSERSAPRCGSPDGPSGPFPSRDFRCRSTASMVRAGLAGATLSNFRAPENVANNSPNVSSPGLKQKAQRWTNIAAPFTKDRLSPFSLPRFNGTRD